MRFSIFTTTASILALASAASIPIEARSDIAEKQIEERQVITALVTAAATAAVSTAATELTKKAIAAGTAFVQDLKDWDAVRQAFTQQVTLEMWNKKPSADIVAVACYNQGYTVKDTSKISGLTSVKLATGVLHTDYDCMFLSGPNAFLTEGDGGFQNLCYKNSNACTYDSKTGDLTCKAA